MKYKRVLLKLSGEALAGEQGFGINPVVVADVARQIKDAKDLGVEIAIVCGGGNIWRGKTGSDMGMERAAADYMGMLATVMNGMALQNALEAIGLDTRLLSAIDMKEVWKKIVLSFLEQEQEVHSLLLIQQRLYVPQK